MLITGKLSCAALIASGGSAGLEALVGQVYAKGSPMLAWLLDCTRCTRSVANLTLDAWYFLADHMEAAPEKLKVCGTATRARSRATRSLQHISPY